MLGEPYERELSELRASGIVERGLSDPDRLEQSGPPADACITCGDVAVAAAVVAVDQGTATIERDGGREQVAIDLVEDVELGDVLLCHAGVALEKVPGEIEERR